MSNKIASLAERMLELPPLIPPIPTNGIKGPARSMHAAG